MVTGRKLLDQVAAQVTGDVGRVEFSVRGDDVPEPRRSPAVAGDQLPVDLDDMSRCPVGVSCVSCGGRERLSVSTLDVLAWACCLTLCVGCVAAGQMDFTVPLGDAAGLVLAHCDHLGITLHQMVAVLRDEQEVARS